MKVTIVTDHVDTVLKHVTCIKEKIHCTTIHYGPGGTLTADVPRIPSFKIIVEEEL